MIVNDLNNKVIRASYSKVITIEDDGDDPVYVFPDTESFLKGIHQKQNAEKLHGILKRVR